MYPNAQVDSELYWSRYCAECAQENNEIYTRFLNLPPELVNRRSHFFQGRYENIYLFDNAIPQLATITRYALEFAAELMGIDVGEIKLGFWLNCMQPGQLTIPHRHDDDDELLSGVYYVRVPPKSGCLLLHDQGDVIRIEPREGQFVFFRPDVLHEVSPNESRQARLSIGMNFGPR